MALFILDDATGIGSDYLNSAQAFVDLAIIVNDDGLGMDDPVGGRQQVTYSPTVAGGPQTRIDALVNTTFNPDYGSGPQQVARRSPRKTRAAFTAAGSIISTAPIGPP
jgi:hypothetical protein